MSDSSNRPASGPSSRAVSAPPVAPAVRLQRRRDAVQQATGAKLEEAAKRFFSVGTFDFAGKVFEVKFTKPENMEKLLSEQILPVLDSEKNKKVLKRVLSVLTIVPGLFTKLDFLKPIAAAVYAKDLLNEAKKRLDTKYPRLLEYLKKNETQKDGLTAKLSSGGGGKPKVEFIPEDPDLFKKYKKWESEHPVPVDNSKKRERKKEKPGKKKEVVDRGALGAFAASPLGKIFRFLRGENNKTWLQLMKEGKAPLAFFVAGLFGYKVGAEMYNGAVGILPDKFKGRLKRFERKARASKLSAKAYAKKHTASGAQVGAHAEVLNARWFETAIGADSISSRGIKLGEDYILKRNEKLVVNLEGGGRFVLPEGVRAYVNGELCDPGKLYENVKITLSGTVPKGTLFLGSVKFEKVIPKKSA